MLRLLYTILLRLHPKQFQARFGDEMLLTFEEARAAEGSARLITDAVLSLFRQHLLRSHSSTRLPLQADQQVLAGFARLSNPPQHGLSPDRLVAGGLISIGLFLAVCFWTRGGKVLNGPDLQGQDANAGHMRPLTPSDLATIHVVCVKQALNNCSSGTQETVINPEQGTEWQIPMAKQQDTHELLLPSGPLGVGRVLYEWPQDRDSVAGKPQTQRRFVFVWYPSSPERSKTKPIASVWNFSKANQLLVETHTVENPPIATGSSLFPVLLFYPSMNSSSAAYTTQIENLVSHGYVVASLEPPADRSIVSFSNMQLFPFAADLRRAYRTGKTASHDSLLQRAIQNSFTRQKSQAADFSFVLDRLTAANHASREIAPFAERLDLSRVGAVGHSDGGTAAGLACQMDQRIRACLSEDGWTPDGPDPEIVPLTESSKPFMWINVPVAAPENGELAYIRMRRAEFDALVRKSEALADKELNALQKGAYRVTLRTPEITDDYFTDGPFVWSMLDPQGNVTERDVLVIVNTYLRAFFDRYLRGGSKDVLDGSVLPFRNVELKRYGALPL